MRGAMKSFLAIIATSFFLLVGGRAQADEAPKAVAAERPTQLHFDLGFGLATVDARETGHGGAIALVRLGMFQAGAAAHYSQYGLSARYGGGIAAGLGLHGASHIGFDALAEFGGSAYGERSSHDLPYVGARMGANVFVGNPDSRFRTTLGLWLYAQHDLGEREISDRRAGTWDEFGLRFAMGFDVTPG